MKYHISLLQAHHCCEGLSLQLHHFLTAKTGIATRNIYGVELPSFLYKKIQNIIFLKAELAKRSLEINLQNVHSNMLFQSARFYKKLTLV